MAVRLMEALAASGDTPAALKHARIHRELVLTELGVEPDQEVEGLAARLTRRSQRELLEIGPSGPAGGAIGSSVPDMVTPIASGRPDPPRRKRPLPILAAGVAALAAALLLPRLLGSAPFDPRRVVVAPFDDQTGDTTFAALGDAAADWLTVALARTGLVDVVDSRWLFRARSADSVPDRTNDSARAFRLAGRTGASTVVWGGYYLFSDSIVMSAQILRSDGRVVRSLEPVAAPRADPMQVIDRLRERVLGAFASLSDPRVASGASAASHPPTYAAYTEYIAGLEAWAHGESRSALRRFERALAVDSSFVTVLPWLAEALTLTGRKQAVDSLMAAIESRRPMLGAYDQAMLDFQHHLSGGRRDAMLLAARQLVRLAPASPDAHWLHGFAAVTTNHFAEAVEAFRRVEQKDGWQNDHPFAAANFPSTAYHLLGDYAAELELMRRLRRRFPQDREVCAFEVRAFAAVAADERLLSRIQECVAYGPPDDPSWAAGMRLRLAGELRTHGRHDLARMLADTAAASCHNLGLRESPFAYARQCVAEALVERGDYGAAQRLFEAEVEARGGRPTLRLLTFTGIAAALAGDVATAESVLHRIASDSALTGEVPGHPRQLARILAALGRRDEAVEMLRAAVASGLSAAELFHTDIALEPLHTYPPYQALVAPR